ncbi:MAG: hypothetical protein R6W67_01505, partial [Bacteroidales bacterium]
DVSAQQADSMVISGTYINTPLQNFIDRIEPETQVKFFFQQEWIKDVTITSAAGPVTLFRLLNDPLKR